MNAPFNTAPTFALPAELDSLSPPPLLLPGESLERYELMRHAIFADLAPRSVIEWLLAIDVVELSWKIQRHRILRYKLLEHFREKAIEQTLRHIDLAGLPSETEDHARYQIQRNARIWRIDPTAAPFRQVGFLFRQAGYVVGGVAQRGELSAAWHGIGSSNPRCQPLSAT